MSALVPVSEIRNLPEVYQEAAVTAYLTQARDRLTEALDATGPGAVAAIKAEVATVAEMTKQLNLSKECRDDATEMVRRAEYSLGKAIRKGQEDGTVMRPGDNGHTASNVVDNHIARIDELLTASERHSRIETGNASVYDISDGVSEEEFEQAIEDARTEGNLSRVNIARKIRKEKVGQSRSDKADLIEQYAREGHTSKQIAPKLGVSDARVRDIAKEHNVDIPADRAIGKRRRLDSNRILSGAAESVAAAAYSLQQINPLDLDQEAAQEWVDSLTESLSALRKALNPIKESIRVKV